MLIKPLPGKGKIKITCKDKESKVVVKQDFIFCSKKYL